MLNWIFFFYFTMKNKMIDKSWEATLFAIKVSFIFLCYTTLDCMSNCNLQVHFFFFLFLLSYIESWCTQLSKRCKILSCQFVIIFFFFCFRNKIECYYKEGWAYIQIASYKCFFIIYIAMNRFENFFFFFFVYIQAMVAIIWFDSVGYS